MHCAVPGHRARLRVFAVAGNHTVDVRCHRCWHERSVSAFKRATGLVALSAKAGPVDAACETIHGISAVGDATLSALRPRRATRPGGSDLGQLLFAADQHRVLDERRVHHADGIRDDEAHFGRACACARAREWHLFHRRQISVNDSRLS